MLKLLAATLALLVPTTGLPQAWPAKPISMIVPFPPGATNDMLARLLAGKMSDAFGQTVLVENRSGAGGTIGAAVVARAAPDGYTLLSSNISHVTAQFAVRNIPYHTVRDFTPITAAAALVDCIVVHPSLPVRNLRELIDYSNRTGKISFGTSGVGSSYHLQGELLNQVSGAKFSHIPYKGLAQAMADLIGGQVPVVLSSLSTAMPAARAGKAKVLVVLQPKRYARMPEVPSVNETLAEFRVPDSWFGFFGPANLPKPLLSRLNAEMVRGLNAPDARAKLESANLTIIANSPEDFAAMFNAAVEQYGKIARTADIRPE